MSDEKSEDEDNQPKQSLSTRYGEEHRLVLNPLPLFSLKQKVEENGIVYIECQVPDRIETEKIPISIIKILHPEMLESFETDTKNNL